MNKVPCCPICKSKETRLIFHKRKQNYFLCQNCGLKFVWPIPTQEKLKEFYQAEYWESKSYRGESALGYLSYLAEKKSFLDYFQKILRQIENLYPHHCGRVLDIGCSFGFFLKVAQDRGWQIYGVDLSPTPVKQARQDLGVRTIFNKDIQQAKFSANSFDLVTVFQTIEHVAELPSFLKEISRILKKGGVVLIATPDAGGWQAKLMRETWFAFRHPDHFWFFTEKNLRQLLEASGFVKVKKLKDPIRLYPLAYLLENFKFYYRGKIMVNLAKFAGKIIGPLGKIRIPIPLTSSVMSAQKQ